jgi:hypothetical protein
MLLLNAVLTTAEIGGFPGLFKLGNYVSHALSAS